MGRTYRTMAHTMSYVDMRNHIPAWARTYAVGDEIAFENFNDDGTVVASVAGFSSRDESLGWPVVDGRTLPTSAGSLAIGETVHVDPGVLPHLVESSIVRHSK